MGSLLGVEQRVQGSENYLRQLVIPETFLHAGEEFNNRLSGRGAIMKQATSFIIGAKHTRGNADCVENPAHISCTARPELLF